MRATDKIDAAAVAQRSLDCRPEIIERILLSHFFSQQIVTMDAPFGQDRERDPRCNTAVVPVERDAKKPGIDDDEIARFRMRSEPVGNKIDIGLSPGENLPIRPPRCGDGDDANDEPNNANGV